MAATARQRGVERDRDRGMEREVASPREIERKGTHIKKPKKGQGTFSTIRHNIFQPS